MNRKEETEKCPNVTCGAPLCLLDPKLASCCWFPDEEICKKNHPPQWVKTQKKVQKRAKDKEKYFNFEMLNRNCIIKKGIVGLDPNLPEEGQLKSWLKKHPAKRILTEEEREILRERFKEKCLVG